MYEKYGYSCIKSMVSANICLESNKAEIWFQKYEGSICILAVGSFMLMETLTFYVSKNYTNAVL